MDTGNAITVKSKLLFHAKKEEQFKRMLDKNIRIVVSSTFYKQTKQKHKILYIDVRGVKK